MLIRRPKAYNAKLVSKEIVNYRDRLIAHMTFKIQKATDIENNTYIDNEYRCYTVGENSLIVGNEYSLKIKEFNWEPKRVEELIVAYGEPQEKVKKYP